MAANQWFFKINFCSEPWSSFSEQVSPSHALLSPFKNCSDLQLISITEKCAGSQAYMPLVGSRIFHMSEKWQDQMLQ